MYLIYTNGIPIFPGVCLTLFINDNMMFHSLEFIQKLKTTAILFNKYTIYNLFKIIIKNTNILCITQAKYLDVIFDNRLTSRPHINNTILKDTRVRSMLYPILNWKNPVPTKTKIQIFLTYIKLITYMHAKLEAAPSLKPTGTI